MYGTVHALHQFRIMPLASSGEWKTLAPVRISCHCRVEGNPYFESPNSLLRIWRPCSTQSNAETSDKGLFKKVFERRQRGLHSRTTFTMATVDASLVRSAVKKRRSHVIENQE